ncbi:MobF family relaxase [Pedococcus sp. 5OH_020]|uniref:MobF family relaxase n=1 Tax=Pedococcus sp. 5OH_020 TaxID=2989814 RepID=UPI0022E9B6CF|nr:MobF family relaxase [Pedococcus sp. 5OH_020]
MTMSIRRMTLGAGYRYLMSSVARMDEAGPARGLTDYYAAKGTPPGTFLGAGLAGLDDGRGVVGGSPVSEEALWRMLGMLRDPVTGQALGRLPRGRGTVFVDHVGRVRKAPASVAGFDLTFSAPKSVSVAWALADEPTRGRIHAAHRRALEQVIAYGEAQVFATRSGHAGAVSEDVRGIVATAFDHWDSRAGDPQLHTHVVVLNRAQSVVGGAWKTLDSKALFAASVGMSELYNGLLADELTRDLGWAWVPETRRRSQVPKWEVDGVTAELRDEFSQRSTAIETAKDQLVKEFVAARGRPPSAPEVIKLRQQATLATRPEKDVKPLNDLISRWRGRADPFLDAGRQERWVAALGGRHTQRLLIAGDLEEGMLRDLAGVVVQTVADKRPTFTRANLLAETSRQLAGVRFVTATHRVAVTEHVATLATERSVMLTPAEPDLLPEHLRRPDGTSRLRARNSEVYATAEILDAEARLLEAGRATDGPVVGSAVAARLGQLVAPGKNHLLSAEQAIAVAAIVTSGRALDVLVGPAGSGKSSAMAVVRAAWEAHYGRGAVVGLAPSAAAAEVLADAVGVPTENTAKWITENRRTPERAKVVQDYAARLARAYPSVATRQLQLRARAAYEEYACWSLQQGQLVIIDEASMAATKHLDHITTHARQVGAKVLLVGDWAQLSPVQAGGAFKLLADDRGADAPTLREVHRFNHEWERDASMQLRLGNADIAHTYVANGRIEYGSREDMLDLLFDAWLTDTQAGRTSLMLAVDTQTVTDLNQRARGHLVRAGHVIAEGVRLADGSTVGVGDLIVTRRNQRSLATDRGWVKNGNDWMVTEVHEDGSMAVTRAATGTSAILPAEYVREHVELGYASTAHRAQGRTVDAAHAYLNAATTLEPLYVMATRGRDINQLYIDIADDPDNAIQHGGLDHADSADVLRRIVETSSVELSATQVRHDEHAATRSREREWRSLHVALDRVGPHR